MPCCQGMIIGHKNEMQLCSSASHKQEPSVFHDMERRPPLRIL
jgi:hypothetical protein